MAGNSDNEHAAPALPPGIANLNAGLDAFTLADTQSFSSSAGIADGAGGFQGYPPAAFGGGGGLPPGIGLPPGMGGGGSGGPFGLQPGGGGNLFSPFGPGGFAGPQPAGDVGAQLTALFTMGGIPTDMPRMQGGGGFQGMPGLGSQLSLPQLQPGLFNPQSIGPGTSVFAPPGLGAAPGMSGRVVPGNLGDLHPGHPPLNCPVMFKNPGIVASLTSQTWNRITICHNEGSHFWVHEDVQSGDLATMEIAMGAYYAANGATIPAGFDFVPGTLYAAPFMSENDDGLLEVTWTRACVLSAQQGGMVGIVHVDYGSTDVLEAQHLRTLAVNFVQLPAQAIKCHLSGMTPLEPDSHDYEGQSEKLAELVNGQFFCQVININRSGECYDVDLYNDNLDTVMPGLLALFPSPGINAAAAVAAAVSAPARALTAQLAQLAQLAQPVVTAPPRVIAPQPEPPKQQPPPKQPQPQPQQPKPVVGKAKTAAPARAAAAAPAPAPAKPAGPVWGSKNSKILAPPTAAQTAAAAVAAGQPKPKAAAAAVVAAARPAGNTAKPVPMAGRQGFVFHCANSTQEECTTKNLFGLPKKFINQMGCIKPALNGEKEPTVLFLYNMQSGALLGTYEAVSEIGLDIDPEAWKAAVKFGAHKRGSPFPAQVRVKRTKEYKLKAPRNVMHIGEMTPQTMLKTMTAFSTNNPAVFNK